MSKHQLSNDYIPVLRASLWVLLNLEPDEADTEVSENIDYILARYSARFGATEKESILLVYLHFPAVERAVSWAMNSAQKKRLVPRENIPELSKQLNHLMWDHYRDLETEDRDKLLLCREKVESLCVRHGFHVQDLFRSSE